jgi:hypothetical protein
MNITELFQLAHSKAPYTSNPHWIELRAKQDKCSHEWVYSPDKEKRVCETCYKRQRSRTFGKTGYGDSLWIAPPEEQDRYRPEEVIKKWKK